MEILATKQQVKDRLDICRQCPSHRGGLLGVYVAMLERCNECGCFLKAKTKLNYASCPKMKW